MFKNLRKKKKGFTLIELIIVIAILAILAAVALPRLGSVSDKANYNSDVANAKTIGNAVAILDAEGNIEDGTYSLATTDTSDNAKNTRGYLQNTPKGKYYDGDFSVTVTGETVEVSLEGVKLFPDAPEFDNKVANPDPVNP